MLILVYCACFAHYVASHAYAQIQEGSPEVGKLRRPYPIKAAPNKNSIEHLSKSIENLAHSVKALNDRMGLLEERLQFKMQEFGNSISESHSQLNILSTRLESLDDLTSKINSLDVRFQDETIAIKTALASTNEQLNILKIKLEDEEEKGASNTSSFESSRNQDLHHRSAEEQNQTTANNKSNKDINRNLLTRVERRFAQLLSTELNHFYLNMESKMSLFQREMILRLRRIESTSKKCVSETQEGRQDVSHLHHLQRTMISDLNRQRPGKFSPNSDVRWDDARYEITNTLTLEFQNFTNFLENRLKNLTLDFSYNKLYQNQMHKEKDGLTQALPQKHFWQIFSPVSSENDNNTDGEIFNRGTPEDCRGLLRNCLQSKTASSPLEEIKKLFLSLISKGEDIKRIMSKEREEGAGLLKNLHQRFSLLLRKLNQDPKHEEALLAEVQELESLVQNSYSSIMLAQNVYMESCLELQRNQPNIEERIINMLNSLIRNLDLRDKFSQLQLQEMRDLIGNATMGRTVLDQGSYLIPFSNDSVESLEHTENSCSALLLQNDLVLQQSIAIFGEFSQSRKNFDSIFDRLLRFESDIQQSLDLNSKEVVKNIVDEILTGLKDLKGYSKTQIDNLDLIENSLWKLSSSSQMVKNLSVILLPPEKQAEYPYIKTSFEKFIQYYSQSKRKNVSIEELIQKCPFLNNKQYGHLNDIPKDSPNNLEQGLSNMGLFSSKKVNESLPDKPSTKSIDNALRDRKTSQGDRFFEEFHSNASNNEEMFLNNQSVKEDSKNEHFGSVYDYVNDGFYHETNSESEYLYNT